MPDSEGVLKVQDRDDEAQEFTEGHNQRYSEGRTLCGQNEHASNAHISEQEC